MTRSKVMQLMLIIVSLVNLISCTTSNQIAQKNERIDTTPFDPIKLIERINEDVARDKTRIRNCYDGANADLSFSTVADENKGKQFYLEYDSVLDRNGQTYHISKRSVIDRSDIDAVCIDKTSYKGNDQYSIIVLFKESSWDKVYDVTHNLINKRIACLMSRIVISAPVVHQAIAQAAQLAVLNKAADIDWFIQGLIPTNKQSMESRDKAYAGWLEKRVQNHHDDRKSLENLAQVYAKIKMDCKKTLIIYESVIELDPSVNFSYYFPMLNSCYNNSGDFDRAIKFYSSLINEKSIEPLTEVYLRGALASAYDGKGDTQKTLQELSLALAATKALPTSYPWLNNSSSKEKIEKKLQDNKMRMVKLLESAIENIKSQKK
jgi:hypothetical protein